MLIIKLFLRILAAIDIIAAFALLFHDYNIIGIGFIIGFVLIGKGLPSLFADPIGKFYGFIDIFSGLMIVFSWTIFPIDVIFFIILIYKGIISFI